MSASLSVHPANASLFSLVTSKDGTTLPSRNFNTTFDADYEKPINVKWFVTALLSFAYGIISLLSVFGNGLIIWAVLRNKRMHNVTNYFISNLALADVIIGLFATPFQVDDSREILLHII